MKPTAIVFVIVLAEALLNPGSASAQNAIPLTLSDAISRGLETSHRVADLSARIDASKAIEDQRKAAEKPQIALRASYTRTNHVEEFTVPNALGGGQRVIYPDIPDNYRTRVDFQWPIYTAGRTMALIKAASGETEALTQDREAARADLKLEITRAYWAVVTSRAAVDVVREALNRINAHLADVKNQLSVGLIPPSDVLSVQAQQAHQQMLAIEAENIYDTASADLRRLVGLPPEALFQLADTNLTSPALSKDAAGLVATAMMTRPERKALQFRIGSAEERVQAADAGRRPMLTSAGGYDVARPNPRIFPLQEAWKPSWDIGVSVNWPVFDGGRVRAETAEARANRRSIEERLKDFDSALEVEVRQRLADLASAEAAVSAAESGVTSAAEARRVLTERFSAGVATSTDVLDAQVALLQAELDRTRALANVQLAAARLDRALGR
jgi:outer membrane protein TolC